MTSSIKHPKVDQTAVSVESGTIFISNIKIPEHYLDNVRPVLERVSAFLLREYLGVPLVKYNVTVTYNLKHQESGTLVQKSGSFLPRECNLRSIDMFYFLGPNFVTRLAPLCDSLSITKKLLPNRGERDWYFHSLTGLVITVQALVKPTYHTLIKRNLKTRRNGGTMDHITFPLP